MSQLLDSAAKSASSRDRYSYTFPISTISAYHSTSLPIHIVTTRMQTTILASLAIIAVQAIPTANAWAFSWFAGQNCNVGSVVHAASGTGVRGCTVIGTLPEPHSFNWNGGGSFMINACTGSSCDGDCSTWRGPGVAGCTNRSPAQGPFRSFKIVAA